MGTRRSHFCANTAFLRANWVRTAARRGTIWMTGGHACERGGGGSGSEGMERCAVGWPWTTPVVELREQPRLRDSERVSVRCPRAPAFAARLAPGGGLGRTPPVRRRARPRGCGLGGARVGEGGW